MSYLLPPIKTYVSYNHCYNSNPDNFPEKSDNNPTFTLKITTLAGNIQD